MANKIFDKDSTGSGIDADTIKKSVSIWTYRIHLIIAWISGIMLSLGLQF